jgi:hypothetical protein
MLNLTNNFIKNYRMTKVDNIRNEIIERLFTISDKSSLLALNKIVENSQPIDSTIKLTEEQKLMLQLSESDIAEGRVYLESDVNKKDLKWLKEL